MQVRQPKKQGAAAGRPRRQKTTEKQDTPVDAALHAFAPPDVGEWRSLGRILGELFGAMPGAVRRGR